MAGGEKTVLGERFGTLVEELAGAVRNDDEPGFLDAVGRLIAEHDRGLIREVGRLTGEMQAALERFQVDPRMLDLAENEVPNARIRLEHVLKMTDEAAHRTLDLVEASCRPAERTGAAAERLALLWSQRREDDPECHELRQDTEEFLNDVRRDAEQVRSNLREVLLAQGYQDLTGQIIRSVITLIAEIEEVLAGLTRLSHHRSEDARASAGGPENASSAGFGPQVAGLKQKQNTAVGGQDDVDSLLSGLGL